jgi:hypothetical protein
MQFNHFLVRDEEPLLFHAGLKGMFPALRESVAKIIDPTKLRHIAWSHFESDEIGALNDWLHVAPQAQPVCTLVGKLVSVDDFSIRPARGMTPEDVLSTGKYRYGFYRSPQFRTAGMRGCCSRRRARRFSAQTSFITSAMSSPLPLRTFIGPTRKAMQQLEQGPLAGYMPYTRQTEGVLCSLADLKPETLAIMHGSSYRGGCDGLLTGLAGVIKEAFDH